MSNVRSITATADPEIIPISRPYSMFDFVEERFQGLGPLRRIMSQVRTHQGRTMVVETLKGSTDVVEENEDLQIRFGEEPSSTITRLSFFDKEFTTSKGLSTATSEQFLGYAVVKEDQIGERHCIRVYESVLRSSLHPNNCIRKQPEWECHIDGTALKIEGYLYAQQNDMTNVCAHVALRSAVSRFHKKGDISYREINQTVGIDHINRKTGGVDGGGLTLEEMVTVLEKSGARCVIGDYLSADKISEAVPFHKYIYGSVESGFPALLAFKTHSGSGHVIPVFGHTFNPDTWVCNADLNYFKVANGVTYIPSESWLSMYLVHDDNFGSNFCIPRRYLHATPSCIYQTEEQPDCPLNTSMAGVIGTIPREVKLMPVPAEIIGADYLLTILPQMPVSDVWERRFKWYAENHRMVLRPILVTKAEYIAHLRAISDWNRDKIEPTLIKALNDTLKEGYYWLVELSLPELFSANKRKVAEVLLNAEKAMTTYRDFKNFALARLPDQFVLYEGGGAANPKYVFIPSGSHGHVQLFGCEKE